MKIKKRSKVSRMRGSRNHGHGFSKKHKGGKGNKGGKGKAGSGKRADHKKQFFLDSVKGKYFGTSGATSKGSKRRKNLVINLEDLQKKFDSKEIKIEKYKVLAKGEGFKAKVYALSASKQAIDKMKKAGGEIIVKSLDKKASEKVSEKDVDKKASEKKVVKKVSKKK